MPETSFIDDIIHLGVPTVQAAALGALFTFVPVRYKKMRKKRKGVEFLKAQVLFCTAGAMLVGVIGSDEHAAARAFGLLGLGSFIRFRTSLKNPTDTAVFFMLIGIGMACGIGRPAGALFGTLFLMLLLTLLEGVKPKPEPASASADVKDEEES